MDHVSSRIAPAFYRFLQHTSEKNYSLDEAREEFQGHILTWAKTISEEGPWWGGKEMSMADLILIPWAQRVFLIDHYKTPGGSGVPTSKQSLGELLKDGSLEEEDEEAWERWVKWFQAVEQRKSVQETLSERQQYIDVYKRYAEDTTGSQVGSATRGGRGLP